MVWEGIVEVFDLVGHPTAHRAYAWSHDGKHPKESSIAVLHKESITSAAAAVRAALIQEFRNLEPAEENTKESKTAQAAQGRSNGPHNSGSLYRARYKDNRGGGEGNY